MYEQARELYIQGESLRNIEKVTGYPRKKLSLKLKEDGIFRQYHDGSSLNSYQCKYEEPVHYEIVELYLSGASMKDLANIYQVGDSTINRILHYHNVNTKRVFRKYKLDEGVFEKIDCEEAAYWLGFLYADGYVNKELSSVELSLKIRDKDHLIRFKKFLKTNSPIVEKTIFLNDKEYLAARIVVCSKKLATDLTKLGCFNKKSLTLEFPTEVPEEHIRHFMRGYFDGDGSIFFTQSKKNHTPVATVSVLGTENFLRNYHSNLPFIKDYKDFDDRFLPENGKAFALTYSGNSLVQQFGNFIYDDFNIFLPRKYDNFAVLL